MAVSIPADLRRVLREHERLSRRDKHIQRVRAALLAIKYKRVDSDDEGCQYDVFLRRVSEPVVKIPKLSTEYEDGDEYGIIPKPKRDFEFIEKMKRTHPQWARRHLPATKIYSTWILVQERVRINYALASRLRVKLEQMGEAMGIDDVHVGNVGWRRKTKKPVPVFFDVGIRAAPGLDPWHIRREGYY